MHILRGTGHTCHDSMRIQSGLRAHAEPTIPAVFGLELHFKIHLACAGYSLLIGRPTDLDKIRMQDGKVAVARRGKFRVAVAQNGVVAGRPPLGFLAHVGPIPEAIVAPFNSEIQTQRHFIQFALRLHPLGNVCPNGDVFLHKPVVPDKGRNHGVHPIHLTIFCTVADFSAPGFSSGYRPPHFCPETLWVVAGIHDTVVLPDQFFACVSTNLLKRVIAMGDDAVSINLRHDGVDVNGGSQCVGLLQGQL